MEEQFYCYIGLDTRKPGEWEFEGIKFEFQPFYAGKGKGDRIRDHTAPKEKSKFSIKANIIEKIIRETGKNPIFKKVYDNLTENDALDAEERMIRHFGRLNNKTGILANLTDGGRGRSGKLNEPMSEDVKNKIAKSSLEKISFNSKRVDQFDLNLNFIKKHESVTAAMTELGLNRNQRRAIYNNCSGLRKSAFGYVWKYDGTSPYEPPKKENAKNLVVVSKYDLDGNFLQTYQSVTLAAADFGVGTTGISSACRNEKTTYKGFQWKYGDSQENIGGVIRYASKKGLNFRPVFQYSKDGSFLNSFESIVAASRYLGSSQSSIERVLYGGAVSLNGFQLFVEDQGPSVPPLSKSGYKKLMVYSYNLDGELLESFTDMKNAALQEGVSPHTLKKAIKLNTILNNKIFKREG